MPFRPFALALACALFAPAASAADEILWQVPWKQGMSLSYATELLTEQEKGTERTKTRATDTTHVRITQASAEGFVQAWTAEKAKIETLAGSDRDARLMQGAMNDTAGMVIEVELDKAGNYVQVYNLEAITPRMRTALRPMALAGVEAGLAELPEKERAAAREKAMPQVDAMMERMLQPAILSALLTRTIQTYNAYVGLEAEPGMTYTVDTELPNPVAGKPIPAKLSVTLTVSEEDPDDLFIDYLQVIDSDKAVDALVETGEQILGRKLSDAERKAPMAFDLRDEGFFVVHRQTGVIEMFENTRTQVIDATRKVERNRMRQLDGDHEHVWKDEEDAAAPEAAKAG